MPKFSKYTKKQLFEAVSNSGSINQVIKYLKLKSNGGNSNTISKYIKQYNIDTSHFHKHGWSKNKTFGPKRPIEDYLSNKFHINTHKLKTRLIKENYFEYKCYNCEMTQWMNKPIPIQLHHKDGNKDNNNLSNLQILCPNCHAQTDNYGIKNSQIYKDNLHRKQSAIVMSL